MCICVHAEQNALISAARFGNAVEGASIYTTTQPCFGCAKELLQAKIQAVHYLHPWKHPNEAPRPEYERLVKEFPQGVHQLAMEDPRADWARGLSAPVETGHSAEGA